MANGERRAARFKGFSVIRDAIKLDQTLNPDDSVTIENCSGFVLVELPRSEAAGLSTEEILERALELALEVKPYGIESLSFSHSFEGNNSFLRFLVEDYEPISDEQRARDNEEARAEERFEARREVRLG